MNEERRIGTSIHADISGDVHGQVAVGTRIRQTQQTIDAAADVTPEDRAMLRRHFEEVKALIDAEAPPEKQPAALERVEELEAAVTAPEPDLTTMEYVARWFGRELPALAGAVTGLVLHPIVGKLVEAAGDVAAAEFRRRFGNP